MSNLFKDPSTILLSVNGILYLFTFPNPLLYTNLAIVSLLGYPKVTYGSTFLNIFTVALFNFNNTALCNCLNLNNFNIFLTSGCNFYVPLILITKATLASAGT